MISRFDRHRFGGGRRAVVLAVSTVLGTVGAWSTVPAAMHQAPVAEQGAKARQQVLEVHRTTVVSLRDAAGEAAPADQVRRALADARKGLEALADAAAAPIPDALRNELRTSASGLTDLADAPRQTVQVFRPVRSAAARARAAVRRRGRRAGADVRGQLQPVQAEGTGVRRPRVGDGAGTRPGVRPRTTACPCPSYSKRGRV